MHSPQIKVPIRIISPIKKLGSSPPSSNLIRSIILPTMVQKHPLQFSSALAHEVRNPLSNINLAIEMLKSSIMDDDQRVYLDIIMRGSSRINDLVTDLLSHFQTDEKLSEKHSIYQMIEEVLSMTKDRIMLKNITVRKDYTAIDCSIWINKQKIKIALTNIVINAIDAMPPANGELRIATKTINGKCIIVIEDNGLGISTKNLENIFKPYFTSKSGGMGLGLSTTLDILQSNHATVEVQSEEGVGTRFILSFERHQQSDDLFGL